MYNDTYITILSTKAFIFGALVADEESVALKICLINIENFEENLTMLTKIGIPE